MRCPNYRLFCPTGLHVSHGEVCERCVGGREWWCVVKNCDVGGSRLRSFSYAGAETHRPHDAFNPQQRRCIRRALGVSTAAIYRRGIDAKRVAIVPNLARMSANVPDDGVGQLIWLRGTRESRARHRGFPGGGEKVARAAVCRRRKCCGMPQLPAIVPPNVQWLRIPRRAGIEPVLYTPLTDCDLAPSRWFEGFPNVVTRAMLLKAV